VDAVIMAIVDRLDVDEDEVEEVKRRARTLADSPSG
jgi:hypothetical protein